MIIEKRQIYYGFVTNRERLDQTFGEALPKKAVIWLSISIRNVLSVAESAQSVMCFYSLDKIFYSLCGVRSVHEDYMSPWHITPFMFNPDNADPRWHLASELERERRQRIRHEQPVSVVETALERMLEYETAWREGKEKPDYDSAIEDETLSEV